MRTMIFGLTLAAVLAVPAPAAAVAVAAGTCWDAQTECWEGELIKPTLKRNFYNCQVDFLYCYLRLVKGR